MRSCDHNRCGSLDEQLMSVSSNLETTESLVKEKDDELKVSEPSSNMTGSMKQVLSAHSIL